MKKKIFRLVVLVLVGVGGFYGVQWYRNSQQIDPEDTLKIYGTVDIRDLSLAFSEQERLVEVLVEEGDRVKAGDVMARQQTNRLEAIIAEIHGQIGAQEQTLRRLRSGSRQQEIAQARAEVEAARIQVSNSEQVLARLEQTSGSGATSEQDLDNARSQLMVERARLTIRENALNLAIEGPRQEDIAAAEFRLESLQANLALLAIRLEDMILKAPSDGIIQTRILEPGEMAGPSRPVLTLALNNPKWVRAYIPEPELGRIRIGMKTRVVNDSFPGQPLAGWIGFISPVAEFTPRMVQTEDLRTSLVYETRVFVNDSEDQLRLGMPVTVILENRQDEDEKPADPVSSTPDSGNGA
ncbi:MAG: HlyD family efflux transporter periplasmic adaptor subunit [Desulfocapsaceae bacterium]|jgi:HlyD family secretion protein|nr:HlyD family efflux transporter periplasmic adaptor subunit [Desulfocapsaceae bacterium]